MNKYIREPGNFFTHFIPAILAFPCLLMLLNKADNNLAVTAAYIYGFAIITVFGVSAIYHSVPKTEYGIRIWQKFDHCCIYIMIAGSFMPTTLLVFGGWVRWFLFTLVWTIALMGCLLKIFNRLKSKAISNTLYTLMGCLIIPFIGKMIGHVSPGGFFWLFLGGVFYIGGTYYYAKDQPLHKYLHSHELWHLFVNMGALSHFVYNYVYVFKG
ncbi:PAQR family membrane homeostasis protein TrhA [Pedobacter sp.]|uniref:PAQR family membrane homeostasis protein TrhA n=1 Tax=Pedobacter sp. TaxID=1411316 RepID=UPI00396C9ED0